MQIVVYISMIYRYSESVTIGITLLLSDSPHPVNRFSGGRCVPNNNVWCRLGNPLGLAGNCADGVCIECYTISDCSAKGSDYCEDGECRNLYNNNDQR